VTAYWDIFRLIRTIIPLTEPGATAIIPGSYVHEMKPDLCRVSLAAAATTFSGGDVSTHING